MVRREKKQTAKLCSSVTKQFVQPSPPEGATVLQRVKGGSRLLLAQSQELDTAQAHYGVVISVQSSFP